MTILTHLPETNFHFNRNKKFQSMNLHNVKQGKEMVRRMARTRTGVFRVHNGANFKHNKTEGTINGEGYE
jgi:hypothetical protein